MQIAKIITIVKYRVEILLYQDDFFSSTQTIPRVKISQRHQSIKPNFDRKIKETM